MQFQEYFCVSYLKKKRKGKTDHRGFPPTFTESGRKLERGIHRKLETGIHTGRREQHTHTHTHTHTQRDRDRERDKHTDMKTEKVT
jgi:hypothetical protein